MFLMCGRLSMVAFDDRTRRALYESQISNLKYQSLLPLPIQLPHKRKARDSNPQRNDYRYLASNEAPRPAGRLPNGGEDRSRTCTGITPTG